MSFEIPRVHSAAGVGRHWRLVLCLGEVLRGVPNARSTSSCRIRQVEVMHVHLTFICAISWRGFQKTGRNRIGVIHCTQVVFFCMLAGSVSRLCPPVPTPEEHGAHPDPIGAQFQLISVRRCKFPLLWQCTGAGWHSSFENACPCFFSTDLADPRTPEVTSWLGLKYLYDLEVCDSSHKVFPVCSSCANPLPF